MIRIGALAAAPFLIATKIFAAFDDQMRTVQAVTGATGAAFETLTEKAKMLGRTTSFTAAQVAAGMVALSRAGFQTGETDAAIAGMLNLARATGTELEEAADIAAASLRSFGLAASDSTRVADILTAAANNSAQTLTDLGEAMKMAAPIASEFEMSLQDTAKAIGMMANFGIKGTMAGTGLRQILMQLSDPKIRTQLKGLGIEGETLADIMISIGAKMEGMSGKDRLAMGKLLFGQRAAGAALKMTRGGFENLAKAIDNADGTAARTAETMDAGIGGAMRRLWSAVEGVALSIGDALAPMLSKMAEKLSGVAGWITMIIEKNPALIKGIAMITAGVIAAGVALVALGLSATMAGAALGIVATAIGIIHGILGAVLSPLGLIAVALVAGGVAFVKYTETGRAGLSSLLSKLREFGAEVRRIFGAVVAAIKKGDLSGAFEIVKTAGLIAFNVLKDRAGWLFLEYIPGVASAMFAGLAGAFGVLVERWREPIVAYMKFFRDSWESVFTAIGDIFASQVTVWREFGALVWSSWKESALSNIQGVVFLIRESFLASVKMIGQSLLFAFKFASGQWVVYAGQAAHKIAKMFKSALLGHVTVVGKLIGYGAKGAGGARKSVETAIGVAQAEGAAGAAATNTVLDAMYAGGAGDKPEKTPLDILKEFTAEFAAIQGRHIGRVTEAVVAADAKLKTATAKFATSIAGLGSDTRAEFMKRFSEIFEGIEGPVDSATTAALREKLETLIAAATAVEPGEKEKEEEKEKKKAGAGGPIAAAGGPAGLAGVGANLVTFNAAAAVAAGSTGGGVQERIVGHLKGIDEAVKKWERADHRRSEEWKRSTAAVEKIAAGLVYR